MHTVRFVSVCVSPVSTLIGSGSGWFQFRTVLVHNGSGSVQFGSRSGQFHFWRFHTTKLDGSSSLTIPVQAVPVQDGSGSARFRFRTVPVQDGSGSVRFG